MTSFIRSLLATTFCVVFPALANAGVPLPGGGDLQKIDFERHVMGLLSKTGCNLGSCHGSFQGKNGFRLSLFGYEPEMDYAAMTRDNLGRRVNLVNPEESLLLLKATGQTIHEGGMRFGKDSWVYQVFQTWIEQGAHWTPGSGQITDLMLNPDTFAVVQPNASMQVRVTAKFADGTVEDVTPFCDFKISDDAIATVSPTGFVQATRPGDAGLAVLYRGTVRAVRILVPATAIPGGYPEQRPVNMFDREIFTKLKLLNMVPSEQCSDEEFLRRVTIDTLGVLPSPAEVRAFLADRSPNKRDKKIDELLKHPLHAALWATKLSDITGNNTDALENPQIPQKARRSQMWHDWLRKRIQDNVPYDQMVRDILTATSLDDMTPAEWVAFTRKVDEAAEKSGVTNYPDKKTLDLFWRRQQQVPIEQWGEKVAAAFMGIRLECAQCHKHPTDRWTQEEYWAFANIFSQVTFGAANGRRPDAAQYSTPAVKKLALEENKRRIEGVEERRLNQVNLVREMFIIDRARPRPNPATNTVPTPQALGGPEIPLKPGKDARKDLADWLTQPDNPYFARSFVNRVWAHYFGVGIVNPVDDFSLANPPTNSRLLDALAAEFTKSGYDLRKLEKSILQTRAYQLSSKPNNTNVHDKNNFARSYVRPLMAEQVVDVLNTALGVTEQFGNEVPRGYNMTEVGASRLTNANLGYVLRIFGRPPRTTACDCERAMEPALPQTLFRMTDPTLLAKLTSNQGRTFKLARDKKLSDQELVEELFLAALTRFPTDEERSSAMEHLKETKDRQEATTDLMWALINTREFILNH